MGNLTRGLITVPDDSGDSVPQTAMADPIPHDDFMPEGAGNTDEIRADVFPPASSKIEDEKALRPSHSQGEAQPVPAGLPVSDWTAVSITILVQP